jgi:hypothetical protein
MRGHGPEALRNDEEGVAHNCRFRAHRHKDGPVSIGLNAEVTVRAGEGILLDGVWLNGEPSYDTYVIVDGEVRYHSPDESVAGPTFHTHNAACGGRVL